MTALLSEGSYGYRLKRAYLSVAEYNKITSQYAT